MNQKDTYVVNLAEVVSPILGFRDTIRMLYEELPRDKNEIIFDFSGVEFISRSVAHELIIIKIKDNRIKFKNLSFPIQKMFDVTKRQMKVDPKLSLY